MRLPKLIRFVFCVMVVYAWSVCAYEYTLEPQQRSPEKPRVTIITSVYNCDKFIKGFLEDIIQQTIFDQCELLMIDADSPGNEEKIIRKYMKRYPNITYIKLDQDPNLYGVWNLGIKLARSEYVTNANTDDRLAPNCYELHAQMLDKHPEVDLVYSDFLYTKKANETMQRNSAYYRSSFPAFEPGYCCKCLPNNHPMWRVSMHEKYGLFDDEYVSAGDWEMWCRAVEGGALFKKVPGYLALFYYNPQGLSTNRKKMKLIRKERERIQMRYGYFFYEGTFFKRDKERVLATQQERRGRIGKKKKRRIKKRK